MLQPLKSHHHREFGHSFIATRIPNLGPLQDLLSLSPPPSLLCPTPCLNRSSPQMETNLILVQRTPRCHKLILHRYLQLLSRQSPTPHRKYLLPITTKSGVAQQPMDMRPPAPVSLAFLVSSVNRLWVGVSAVGGVLSDTPETDTRVAVRLNPPESFLLLNVANKVITFYLNTLK